MATITIIASSLPPQAPLLAPGSGAHSSVAHPRLESNDRRACARLQCSRSSRNGRSSARGPSIEMGPAQKTMRRRDLRAA
eukprot:8925329-Pyramimonas_sp.AAC.1